MFEFGDQPWLPSLLRDAETAYMSAGYRLLPLSQRWAEKISTVLRLDKPAEILDLCSGSGGAMDLIVKDLEKRGFDVRVQLSDLYPNRSATVREQISWLPAPVDATRVPPELAGVRTMFSAFHHFRPDAAKGILRDAFDHRRPICIFESGQGTLIGVAMTLLIPVNVLALMPFARPFRWGYLLFTDLIPLMPLIIFWDGIVSMLRIYSPERMTELTGDMVATDYSWEIGRIAVNFIPGGLPYLIGKPTASGDGVE